MTQENHRGRNIMGLNPDEQRKFNRNAKWDAQKTEAAEHFLHGLLTINGISEAEEGYSTPRGWARTDLKEVRLPKHLDSPLKLIVALHEVAHCVFSNKKFNNKFEDECMAEIWAYHMAKMSGFITEGRLKRVSTNSKRYLTEVYEDLPEETKKSVDKTFYNWVFGLDPLPEGDWLQKLYL